MNLDDPFCPETVAHDLRKEFKHQLEIFESTRCLKIRYEDFCMDRTVFDRIRAFVESGIPGIGKIGGLSQRNYNQHVHDGEITAKQVERWKTEPDPLLVEEAHETFALLQDYCQFWGYEE